LGLTTYWGNRGDFLEFYSSLSLGALNSDSTYVNIQNVAFNASLTFTNSLALALSGTITQSYLGQNISINAMTMEMAGLSYGQASTITTIGTLTLNSFEGLPSLLNRTLSGGTTLNENHDPIRRNISTLTDIGAPSVGDELLIKDISAGDYKKVLWSAIAGQVVDPRFSFILEDDFVSAVTASKLNWTNTVSGTNASVQYISPEIGVSQKAIGVIQGDTGTTATGRACTGLTTDQIFAIFNERWNFDLRFRAAPNSVLSAPTERYALTYGFHDNNGAGIDGTDGMYFRYRDDLNGGLWQAVTSANSVRTITNLLVGPLQDDFQYFRIVFTDGLTPSVEFYIDDVLVATHTTDIPNSAGQRFGLNFKIEKTVGTTQRNHVIDYVWSWFKRVTDR
jgi:hypothetical protein